VYLIEILEANLRLNLTFLIKFLQKGNIIYLTTPSTQNKISISDKSVRDNTQQCIINMKDNNIKVISKIYKHKVGEYIFDLKEWKDTYGINPTFNVNYNKRLLIKKKYKMTFKQNYLDVYNDSLNSRLIDSQVMAINKAYEIYLEIVKLLEDN